VTKADSSPPIAISPVVGPRSVPVVG